MTTNPEIDQDRVYDTVDHFTKFGYIMFPQQVTIYKNIAKELEGGGYSVIEAGCGNGLGTAILERDSRTILGTDKLLRNINFARCLYSWIPFRTWDINLPCIEKAAVVVCIEAIEHVENPKEAIKNLINSASQTVWISTPNGINKHMPPKNPYHVCEYTPGEMLDMIGKPTKILHWKDLSELPVGTRVDPVVYRVQV